MILNSRKSLFCHIANTIQHCCQPFDVVCCGIVKIQIINTFAHESSSNTQSVSFLIHDHVNRHQPIVIVIIMEVIRACQRSNTQDRLEERFFWSAMIIILIDCLILMIRNDQQWASGGGNNIAEMFTLPIHTSQLKKRRFQTIEFYKFKGIKCFLLICSLD